MKNTDSPSVTVVIPVLNGMPYLRDCLNSVVRAREEFGSVEVIVVDNGSSDGSMEMLESEFAGHMHLVRCPHASIAAVRNCGARRGAGEFLSFIDSDCTVPPGYFTNAVSVLAASGASATGCKVLPPERDPHWIEDTWLNLHRVNSERDAKYINSGNLFVRRSAFEVVGGFDEELVTGEDSEFGQRLRASGYRLRESPLVRAHHLKNPRTLTAFFRKEVWHALGMFATVNRRSIDRPTAMMLVHLALTSLGLYALWATSPGGGLLVLAGSQIIIPAATVAFRFHQRREVYRPFASMVLYWLYYWARLVAVPKVFARRMSRREDEAVRAPSRSEAARQG